MSGMFILKIKLGNAAMQTPEDIAHELSSIGEQMALYGDDSGRIFDGNGNSVGAFSIVTDEAGDMLRADGLGA